MEWDRLILNVYAPGSNNTVIDLMSSTRRFKPATAAIAVAIVCFCAPGTVGATGPYCQKTRSRAESRASLLFAPRLTAQLLHLPTTGDADGSGTLPGEGYQTRAALTVSPINIYRGVNVLQAANFECERYRSRELLQETLRQGSLYGKAAALEVQAAFVESQLARVDLIVTRAEEKLSVGDATVLEVDELRLRRLRLKRNLEAYRAEASQLNERGLNVLGTENLAQRVDVYELTTMALERNESILRRLDSWRLNMRMGMIPERDTDWFGVVELSYNFGGIYQSNAEDEYLEARRQELRTSRSELQFQVEVFQRSMKKSVAQLVEELDLLNKQIELIGQRRAQLDQLETAESGHQIEMLDLETIERQSERVFIRALLTIREAVSVGGQNEH